MQLKFVPAKNPRTSDPKLIRRRRLIEKIDQKMKLYSASEARPSLCSWVWLDDDGRYFVSLKYGRRTLELKKGMYSVQVDSFAIVHEVLGKLRTMVSEGDLDQSLTEVANEIRRNFSKS